MRFRRGITFLSLAAVTACGGTRVPSTAPTPLPLSPPITFVLTTSDARMTRVIDVREGLSKADVFKASSDYLAQKLSIDVSDLHAGYLMTPWLNGLVRAGAPDLRYRTRLIIRVSEDGRHASVRSEANWQRGEEWDVGYDTQNLEDAILEMRTRVGKMTPN